PSVRAHSAAARTWASPERPDKAASTLLSVYWAPDRSSAARQLPPMLLPGSRRRARAAKKAGSGLFAGSAWDSSTTSAIRSARAGGICSASGPKAWTREETADGAAARAERDMVDSLEVMESAAPTPIRVADGARLAYRSKGR